MTGECKITEARLEPCEALNAVMDERPIAGRGLTLQSLVNMKTGNHSRDIVVLFGGDHKKKGIVLNECPFCGEPILPNPIKDETP